MGIAKSLKKEKNKWHKFIILLKKTKNVLNNMLKLKKMINFARCNNNYYYGSKEFAG